MKVSEVSLGQTVYVEFDKGSTHIGIVVKIKDSRIFCGTPTITYYDTDIDAIHETSLENVHPSLISLFEVKLKRMEEEKNRYIEDYADKVIKIQKIIERLQEKENGKVQKS